jgi:phosphate:Na+ symporter
MKLLSDGIQKTAGDRLQKIINFMTGNRVTAVFTGFFITALIQSSSATTVMVVSFVNASLLSLNQAAGVIMGANIGTTVTGWLVAILGFKVKIVAFALPAVGIGIPFLFLKNFGKRSWGEVLIGFGILFIGLSLLKDSVPDIRNNPEVLQFITRFTGSGMGNYLLFVLVGTILTFIVQSSSAAMAITLTMAYSGWIDFPTAAAIVMGENIGTTITAFIASFSGNTNARRASRIHTIFNVFGAIWMTFLFNPFIRFIDMIVPGEINGQEGITAHLAMFHTMFNIANTLIFILLVPQLVAVSKKLVFLKEKFIEKYSFKYISTGLQHTPELMVGKAQIEIGKMAEIVEKMLDMFTHVFLNPKKNLGPQIEELKSMEDYTDDMQEEISRFLVECAEDNVKETTMQNINAMMRIVSELESIGDSCFNLILLSQRRYDKKIKLTKDAVSDIETYIQLVKEYLRFNRDRLNKPLSDEEYQISMNLERRIDEARDMYKKTSRKRLKGGANVRGELLFLDFVKHLEHIGDHSLNISQALLVVS